MAQTAADAMKTSFRAIPADQRLEVLKEAAADLPKEDKKELAQTLLFGLEPSPKIRDILYLMVIGALLIILLATAGVVAGIIESAANVDKVLGIFTTVLSFIIGLFVPSPAARQQA